MFGVYRSHVEKSHWCKELIIMIRAKQRMELKTVSDFGIDMMCECDFKVCTAVQVECSGNRA